MCTVKNGKPDATIRWIRNGRVLVENTGEELVYIFVPTKEDHRAKLTCAANNSLLETPLSENVYLNIECKRPSVQY